MWLFGEQVAKSHNLTLQVTQVQVHNPLEKNKWPMQVTVADAACSRQQGCCRLDWGVGC
jgi:hypothetical protein